jgi:Ca-activated chloride channel family protein
VVLLTDGANTRGVTPESAAEQAAERGVRVYPIGFGTDEPTQMVCTSEQLGGGMFDGPPQGLGGRSPRPPEGSTSRPRTPSS